MNQISLTMANPRQWAAAEPDHPPLEALIDNTVLLLTLISWLALSYIP